MILKPDCLNSGDTVAFITLAWGGAGEFLDRYLIGKQQVEEEFGVKVVNTPNALRSEKWIYDHPEKRLQDLLWAFENPTIKAIISNIGGDDSIRLLNHLKDSDLAVIRNNPKIFLGMSDTTVINFICTKAGIVSFYGPTVLYGLAENGGIHQYTIDSLRKTLFSSAVIGEIKNNTEGWTVDKVPWKLENAQLKRRMNSPLQPVFLQGFKKVSGHLIGGCIETLEILKGTTLWPDSSVWDNAILFLETSEESPTPDQLAYWLRNYGAQGILSHLSGILFGIPGGDIDHLDSDYDTKIKEQVERIKEYDDVFVKVAKEYGREDLPIVTRLPFGHTCPMLTLPVGVKMSIDPIEKKLYIDESAVVARKGK